MFEKLRCDARANDFRITAIFILLVYRIGNEIYYSNINKYLKKYLLILVKILEKIFIDIPFGCEIHYKSRIGKGLRIVHPKDIIISSSAVIGESCTIFNGVTVGVNEHSQNKL